MGTSPAVDCHAHVFSATAPAIRGARYRPAYPAPLASWQDHWRRAGVTHGVLVQPSFFGTENAELVAALGLDPGRLRGVAVVDPEADDAALDRMHAAGVRAVRLNLRGALEGLVALPPWQALLGRAHARGWHAEVFADAGRVPAIVEALGTTPASVVFDHFGHPDPAAIDATFAAVARLAATRPVWAKLSAPYRLEGCDPVDLARRWLAAVGPARLVWGSDWPWTGHEEGRHYRTLADALPQWVGAEAARGILWDNPARLYRFA